MLIGSDMLTTLDRWFLYRRIISSVTVVAGCRDDEDLDAVQEAADVLRKEGAEIILLSFEPVETRILVSRVSSLAAARIANASYVENNVCKSSGLIRHTPPGDKGLINGRLNFHKQIIKDVT